MASRQHFINPSLPRQSGAPADPTMAETTLPRPLDAIDRLADGYYEMDRGFRYRRVNPAGLRIAQKTPAEMLGKHVFEVFPIVEESAIHQTVVGVMNSQEAASVETYYPPHHRWYVNSIYPVADGIAIFSRDITAQKLLEENLAFLAEASKILSSALDYQETLRTVAQLAVPRIADWCAVDMLSATGSVELLAIAHAHPEQVRWADEWRQRTPVDLNRPIGLAKVLRTGRAEFYPVIDDALLATLAKDAQSLDLARRIGFSSAMIVPLLARDETVGAITFVTAKSGRHYSAADLSMAEELASRAALAIENSWLYGESQKAVALRDDFISIASHELKTPVTSLKVYGEVLQRQAAQRGEEQTSRHLRKMNGQIDRLATLVSDLLDVSRIESGKLELRLEVIDLQSLVDETVETTQATIDTHQIEITGEIVKSIIADRERISQVLTNLLVNAVKYSPQTSRVIVRLAEADDNAVIEVEDFGIGMDTEHLAHVFDRFYRISSADERTFPGLGMGLYISREIVHRHGGSLQVTSAKGHGSVFRVTFPLAGATEARAMRDDRQ